MKCYLFELRRQHAQSIPQVKVTQSTDVLKKRNPSIPFAYLLDDQAGSSTTNLFGTVLNGSLLSYQLRDHGKEKISFSLCGQVTDRNEPYPPLETLHYPRLPV